MYKLQITTEIEVSPSELEKLFNDLDETKYNIFLIHDVDGKPHLIDWNFVTDSHYTSVEHRKPIKPDRLPEMEKVS